MSQRLLVFAQLMFGLVLGAHYERAFFAAIACLYLLLYATGFHSGRLCLAAYILASAFSLPIATMIIATSSGGLAEITI